MTEPRRRRDGAARQARVAIAAASCCALAAGATPLAARVIYLKPKTEAAPQDAATPAARVAPRAPVSARQTYSISDFNVIRLEAPIDVVVTTGKGVTAVGTGDRATLDALVLDVGGGQLSIRLGRMSLGQDGRKPTGAVRLTLSTNAVTRVTVVGSGRLGIDRLKGDQAGAILRGSGLLEVLDVKADRIDASMIGAGSLSLKGAAADATLTATGSGRLDAAGLVTQRLRLNGDGSIEATATARENATVSALGAANVTVRGTSDCTVRTFGSATVDCRK